MRYPLIDARLKKHIIQHWPSRCTIKTVNYTVTSSNQKLASSYSDVVGMVDIPCRLAPFIETRITDTERRTTQVETKQVQRTCKLSGYYPQIDTRRMVAVIDAIVYSIRANEPDSESLSTRIRLEILTP